MFVDLLSAVGSGWFMGVCAGVGLVVVCRRLELFRWFSGSLCALITTGCGYCVNSVGWCYLSMKC